MRDLVDEVRREREAEKRRGTKDEKPEKDCWMSPWAVRVRRHLGGAKRWRKVVWRRDW